MTKFTVTLTNRMQPGKAWKIQVRELKNHFVDANGTKYSKDTGSNTGDRYPAWKIQLDTLTPVAA